MGSSLPAIETIDGRIKVNLTLFQLRVDIHFFKMNENTYAVIVPDYIQKTLFMSALCLMCRAA
jgi:hypothetical protein